MTAAWSSLQPDVAIDVPGAPVLVIENALRRAAQQFFAKSRAWQVITDAAPVAADQAEVTITPPDNTELVRVETVWLDGRKIDPTTAGYLDAAFGSNWTELAGAATKYLQLVPGTLRLFRIPASDADTGLTARIAVQPSSTAAGIPDDLGIRFREALVLGAKARLLLMPKKGWTDLELGASLMGAFDAAAASANAAATVRGHTNARPRTSPSYF